MAAAELTDNQSLEKQFIDFAHPRTKPNVDTALLEIVAATKASPLSIMRDYISLAFGPGKISFSDYARLRLFDREFWDAEDRRNIVGKQRGAMICHNINYRHDWWALVENKIATCSFLSAYGIPTTPILAVYCENFRTGVTHVVTDGSQLRDVLVNRSNYPMFGKPTEEQQSLGSIGLQDYLGDCDNVQTCDGRLFPLGEFIEQLRTHYASGYIFQKLISPHTAIRSVCGDRVATVRVITLADGPNPRVFRACWKIPAGQNMADNYWRKGNLLAQVDIAQGQVLRALSGVGLDLVECTSHPDSNAPMMGFRIPHWQSVLDTAIEAARLLRHVPLVGWDIAVTDEGPVIIEMNQQPDFDLPQLADARGILEPEFVNFIEVQERKFRDYKKTIRQAFKAL